MAATIVIMNSRNTKRHWLLEDKINLNSNLKSNILIIFYSSRVGDLWLTLCCRQQIIVSTPVQLTAIQHQVHRLAPATDFCMFTSITFYYIHCFLHAKVRVSKFWTIFCLFVRNWCRGHWSRIPWYTTSPGTIIKRVIEEWNNPNRSVIRTIGVARKQATSHNNITVYWTFSTLSHRYC